MIFLALVLHRLAQMSCRLGRAPPVVRSAERTALCRALRSFWVLLPYQAVVLPVRRLSKMSRRS